MALGATRRVIEIDVKLAAQAAQNVKSMADSMKGLEERSGGLLGSLKALGAGLLAAFSIREVVSGVTNVIDKLDALNDQIQRVGVGAEFFQSLSFAAKQSGVETGQSETSLRFLSRTMAQFESGSGKAGQALKQLGITQKDIAAGTEQVFLKIAKRVSELPDGFQKTDILMKAFGRSGAALAPLFNEGADGIKKMMDLAVELGGVMSGETLKAADKFNDKLGEIKLSLEAIGKQIVANMLGPLTKIAELFTENAKNSDLWARAGKALGEQLLIEAAAIIEMIGVLNKFGVALSGAAEIYRNWKSDVMGGKEDIATGTFTERLKKLWDFASSRDPSKGFLAQSPQGSSQSSVTMENIGNQFDRIDRETKELTDKLKKPEHWSGIPPGPGKRIGAGLDEIETKLGKADKAARERERAEAAAAKEKERATDAFIRSEVARIDAMIQEDEALMKMGQDAEIAFDKLKKGPAEAEKAMQDLLDVTIGYGNLNSNTWQVVEDNTSKSLNRIISELDRYAMRVTDTFVDWATAADGAKLSFGDMATSIIRDLIKLTVQITLIEPLLNQFRKAITGINWFGPSTSAIPSGASFAPVSFEHFGSNAPFSRLVDPRIFAGAPRLHNGLMGDEFPAVLQRGEKVIPRGQSAGSNVTVTVINNVPGAQARTSEQTSANGERQVKIWIEQAVSAGMATGRFDGVLGQSFGLSRLGNR